MSDSNKCPICQHEKAAHLLTCRTCFLETPRSLNIRHWTTAANAHAIKSQLTPWQPPEAAADAALTHAQKAILSHLKQFSSAIP